MDAHSDAQLRAVAAASDPAARPKTAGASRRRPRGAGSVWDLVASNPRTPTRVLRRPLTQRLWGLPRFDLRVAQNGAATAGLLRQMARSDDSGDALRRGVASEDAGAGAGSASRATRHPRCGPRWRTPRPHRPRCWRHWRPTAMCGCAATWRGTRRHPKVVLEALLGDRRAVVRAAAVSNRHTPTELAAGRVWDRAVGVRLERGLAPRDRRRDPRGAGRQIPKTTVRRAVARNTRTPAEILGSAGWGSGISRCAAGLPTTLPRRRGRWSTARQAGADRGHRWLRSGLAAQPRHPRGVAGPELATDPEGLS